MITLEQMLLCGVHLGHNIKSWNPKMNRYIYGKRNNIHIIDLIQTYFCLEKVCSYLSTSRKNNKICGTILTNFSYFLLIKFVK
jgi:small subunit ribosomal protein S2